MTFLLLLAEYWWVILIVLLLFSFIAESIRKSARKDAERALEARRNSMEDTLLQKQTSLDFYRSDLDRREHEIATREANLNNLVRSRLVDMVQHIAGRDYFRQTPAFQAVLTAPNNTRLFSSLSHRLKIQPQFDISAHMVGDSGKAYAVTLHNCTCEDYTFRHQPCKHMFRLAVEVGALLSYDFDSLEERLHILLSAVSGLESKKSENERILARIKREQRELNKIANSNIQSYPWLASLYADYFSIKNRTLENHLLAKRPPAKKASEDVRALRSTIAPLHKQVKLLEYQLHLYETLFPWLEEFRELSPQEAQSAALATASGDNSDEYKSLRHWLSPDEYETLSTADKYQLALDRYQSRNKTSWEAGIEYERYIGYLCESNGYRVYYSGARLGLEDMGRDLVLHNDASRIIVQCKRWAREKTIHEKHIFQLFGSCVLFSTQNPDLTVRGVFVTSAKLSDLARQCAECLDITVYENIPFASYPTIKCNISRSGEKIYHLPFDQQYDTTVIDFSIGEFFASTVAEAESAGFRRAMRHAAPSPS